MSRTAPDDYCRVCKCCFKQKFGNFSKIVHVSSQNMFKPSQREESFGIVLSDLCDKVGLPLKNSEYHSTKICNTCSRKILKVHELQTELKSSVNTLHEKFQHHYEPKDVDAPGKRKLLTPTVALVHSTENQIAFVLHEVLRMVSLEGELDRNLRVKNACLAAIQETISLVSHQKKAQVLQTTWM